MDREARVVEVLPDARPIIFGRHSALALEQEHLHRDVPL